MFSFRERSPLTPILKDFYCWQSVSLCFSRFSLLLICHRNMKVRDQSLITWGWGSSNRTKSQWKENNPRGQGFQKKKQNRILKIFLSCLLASFYTTSFIFYHSLHLYYQYNFGGWGLGAEKWTEVECRGIWTMVEWVLVHHKAKRWIFWNAIFEIFKFSSNTWLLHYAYRNYDSIVWYYDLSKLDKSLKSAPAHFRMTEINM